MSNKLRIVFKKGEGTRFIGHLDILRTFIRAMRRANVPVKYSEGFNPHAVMTFALPMGVGVTSECEIMDVMLKEYMPECDIVKALNDNLQPGGIYIISAQYTDSAMPEIEKAEYIVDIANDGTINIDDINNALLQKEILVEKKSKKKQKTVNIAEHIFESEILECSGDMLKLRLVISAGNTFNVKPSLVVDALSSVADSLNPLGMKAHRVKFLFK